MQVNIQLSKLKRPRKNYEKSSTTLYVQKKTIYPGTQGRKNKVFERPIDLTGIKKSMSWANVRWVKVRLAFPAPSAYIYITILI